MRRSWGLLSSSLLVSVLAPMSTLSAQDDGIPRVAYELLVGSTYQEGCFEACDCYIIEEQPMEGTFDLVFYPYAGPLWRAAVEHVKWAVPSLALDVAGSGSLLRVGDRQQLHLDLAIDGGPVTSFDSVVEDGKDAYPIIDTTIAMHDLYCYDIALRVQARPVVVPQTVLTVDRSSLTWTAVRESAGYDVVCGDLLVLRAAGDFGASTDRCLADDTGATALPYALDVGEGQAIWFLVREQGGTYDSDVERQPASRDPAINASTVSCP